MARQNPVSEREKQMCQRLLEFRRSTKLSRKAMAEEIGFTVEQLKGYETGRVPLPYSFAAKLCRTFYLNPAWLAEGKHPIKGDFGIDPQFDSTFPPRRLFSSIYEANKAPEILYGSALERRIEDEINKPETGVHVEIIRGIGTIDTATVLAIISKTLSPLIDSLPPSLRLPFYRYTINAFYTFEKLHGKEIAAFSKQRKPAVPADESLKVVKSPLTLDSLKGNCDDVKSELERLMARVKRQASKPGAKAKLAKFLDVAPARITEWLHDNPEMRKEPGGNYTLQLLKWVEQQER